MKTKIVFAMAGLATALIAAVPQSVEAASLRWNLQDAFLSNGAQVTGSFTYDDVTGTYSNILIQGAFATYDGPALRFSTGLVLRLIEGPAPVKYLNLAFVSSLFGKSIGDTVALDTSLPLPIGYESPSGIFNFAEASSFVGGSVRAVPTPALLPGLIGLGIAALRRKDEESVEENA